MKTFTALKMTFFSLLLLLFTPAYALTPGHDDCADRTCGKHLIRYPFWIGAQQPSYCGYPPLNLTCINQTGTPVLTILGFEFYVNHIFYDNKSIQLTSSFYANNNPCAFLFTNITGNVFPFTLSSSNKEIVFFRNCSSSKNLLSYQNMSCHGDSVHFGGEFNGWDRLSLADKTCQLLRVPVAGNSPMTINGDYVALLKNGWLLNWTTPDCSECRHSGGRCRYDESAAKFVCICRDRIHLKRCGFSEHHMSSKKIIITVTAGLVVLVLCPCVLLVYYKISNEKEEEKIEALLNVEGSLFPKRYKYSEIKKMTKSFSGKLGQGGFGTVYKGTLKDGHLVAVKILHDSTGNVEEFINELASISRTSHVNIVNLLGFCLEGSKRALVCEFMPNGSLEKYIYAEKSKALGYERLYGIAVGIARGLEYLHCRCNTRIVHFDIKPHNILLDQDFCPKISDFGLAKLCTKKKSVLSMAIPRGTIGYIAPEVYSSNFRVVSSKSDVYSYGMMVLEMFGIRRDFDAATIMSKSEIYFPNWIHDCLNTTNDDIIGIACLSNENKEITQKMITVSLWCIQMIPTSRPSMSRVLDMLEGSIDDLQMPRKQY